MYNISNQLGAPLKDAAPELFTGTVSIKMENRPFRGDMHGVDETDLPPSKINRTLKYVLFAFTSFFWVSHN